MAFPASPLNGETTTQNGIDYVYNSAENAWTRVAYTAVSAYTLSAADTIKASGNIVAAATTISINTTTGALVVRGGTGIAGNLNVGGVQVNSGNIIAAATTTSTSTTTGALVVKGGAGVAGNLYVGGILSVAGSMVFGNITLSDNSYINTATVYDLDDISPADGRTNTFRTLYNQNAVTFTNPWQLLVTVDGAVQPAFDNNYDTVWFGMALTASRGYTIDTTGNIKFADCPAQGSTIMARTVVGSPNPTKKVYPFKPLDILLGI